MRVLICGDRNWTDHEVIANVIEALPPQTVVIHGGARGADTITGTLAFERGLDVIVFPAKWDLYHKAAGIIRNKEMLDKGRPDLVVYCHDDLSKSRGTAHMVRYARSRGVEVRDCRNYEKSS